MIKADLTKVEEALEKSGFLLEYQVTEKLIKGGWSVINNRYYLDDVQEIAREIDLVAYKTHPIKLSNSGEKIMIYTALIISCKKSERNLWALLFRDHDKKNPNMDWFPLKNWTNHKVFKHLISEADWRSKYEEAAEDEWIYDDLFEPTGHLFAYQEIDKTKFTLQNQTNIFNAVSSLMKAESYEMESLERRKKEASIYNFNLISIVDSDLVKVHCKGHKSTASSVDETKAIFNYIVNKKETSSRIHFFSYEAMAKFLKQYNVLHELNKRFLTERIEEFYKDVLGDRKRFSIISHDFLDLLSSTIGFYVNETFGPHRPIQIIDLSLSKSGDLLSISLFDLDNIGVLDFLNHHKELNKYIKGQLKKLFNYTESFVFIETDIPF